MALDRVLRRILQVHRMLPVNRIDDLLKIRERLRRLQPGEPFTAVVLRAGRVVELTGRAR